MPEEGESLDFSLTILVKIRRLQVEQVTLGGLVPKSNSDLSSSISFHMCREGVAAVLPASPFISYVEGGLVA